MGGGEQAKNTIANNPGILGLNSAVTRSNDQSVLEALQKYSAGGASLQDIMQGFQSKQKKQNTWTTQDRDNWVNSQKGGMIAKHKADTLAEAQKNAPRYGGSDPKLAMSDADYDKWATDALNQQYEEYNTQQNKNSAQENAELNRALMQEMVYDPMTGTKMATEQVQDNELLKGMFGKGGMQDRMLSEEQELASRGWSLKPEDYEAYGQASDETARMFGQEEASLANALASRGLAAAPSGAAGVGYAGLAGNKYERLAGAQRKIADDRMKMNMERLNNVRNFSMQSNRLAQAAIQDQYGRNVQGVQGRQQVLKDSANAGQMAQGQENVAFDQQQATKGPGTGEILGGILGMGAGAFTGGLGTSLGGGLGQTLGGVVDKKTGTK